MFSILRKGLIYKNISQDIVEHDLDIDVDQWSYDQKDVYKGSLDQEYIMYNLHVYWLYDEDSKRVGLAEHEADDSAVFKTLWFYDNPYATLYQEPLWKSTNETLWSKLSTEAYQDMLETDFKHVTDICLNSGCLLVTPTLLTEKVSLFDCKTCGKKSLQQRKSCPTMTTSNLDFSQFSILFIDDDFVIYQAPNSMLPQLHAACEQEPLAEQVPLVDQEELKDTVHPVPAYPIPLE